jgi:hypothetical protein
MIVLLYHVKTTDSALTESMKSRASAMKNLLDISVRREEIFAN